RPSGPPPVRDVLVVSTPPPRQVGSRLVALGPKEGSPRLGRRPWRAPPLHLRPSTLTAPGRLTTPAGAPAWPSGRAPPPRATAPRPRPGPPHAPGRRSRRTPRLRRRSHPRRGGTAP